MELRMVDFPACATIDDTGGDIIYRDLTRYHLASVDPKLGSVFKQRTCLFQVQTSWAVNLL